jgi:hypothetical protein
VKHEENTQGHQSLVSCSLHGAWALPFMMFLLSYLPKVYAEEFMASPVRFTMLVFGVYFGGMAWAVKRVSRTIGTWLDRHRGTLSKRALRVELVKTAALYMVPLPFFGLLQTWLANRPFAKGHFALFMFLSYEAYGVLVMAVDLLRLRFSRRWRADATAS